MNRIIRKTAALAVVGLVGLSACADLDVVNPNAPDAERALATPGDVETLIQGSFGQWWLAVHHFSGPSHVFANLSFQTSSWPANFGMVFYSQLPRVAVVNEPTDQFYENVVDGVWSRNYRALSAVSQGLRSLDDPEISEGLGPERTQRARAFGKFMQGLSHGSLALFYEEAFIVDETFDPLAEQQPVPYNEVMEAALGFFDEAIQLSSGTSFNIPSSWMSVALSSDQLARIAHSMRARYRANVARTPAERDAVNWNAVIADVDAGVENGFNMVNQVFADPFWNDIVARCALTWIGWCQESYMINGMADQSGQYQAWLDMASSPQDRFPDFDDGSPVMIITPDLRFPQGETPEEQRNNPGTMREFQGLGGNGWSQPARGTHRWSHYRTSTLDFHFLEEQTSVPEITPEEMRLLKAEGFLRTGNAAAAADLINVTRTAAGLNATDAAGTNTDCVPRLPDRSCGDLLEMLKWEKRLHTAFFGVHANTWYFDGRGWGDLYRGTPLHLPLPCLDAELLFVPCTTTGGVGGDAASPGSVYNFPLEG